MAMHSGPASRFICCFLLLATFSVSMRTEAIPDQAFELAQHILNIGWPVTEVIHKKTVVEKLQALMQAGISNSDYWHKIPVIGGNGNAPPHPAWSRSNALPVGHGGSGVVQIIHTGSHKLPVGDGGSGAVRSIRTGNQRFSVLAVDVANMFTMTSMCDLTPGLGSSWVICNSPPTAAATWALFKGTVVVEGALREQQAQARAFYLCMMPSSQAASSNSLRTRAVLGLGLAGSLPQALKNFSYHLGSEGRQSTVWLGGSGPPVSVGRPTATIRLIGNPQHPERYYVSVTGIQVDGRPLEDLPLRILELNPRDGTGGVYMRSDPFDTLTYLNRAVYSRLVREFQKRLYPAVPTVHSKLQEGRLCYTDEALALAQKVIPKLALVFDGMAPGQGAVMQLHMDNYWGKEQQLQCLAIKPSPFPTGESVLGSRLQWGWRMTYDLQAGTLQATPASAILGSP